MWLLMLWTCFESNQFVESLSWSSLYSGDHGNTYIQEIIDISISEGPSLEESFESYSNQETLTDITTNYQSFLNNEQNALEEGYPLFTLTKERKGRHMHYNDAESYFYAFCEKAIPSIVIPNNLARKIMKNKTGYYCDLSSTERAKRKKYS